MIKKSGYVEQVIYNSTISARLFVAPDLTILFFNKRAYKSTVAFRYRELKVGDNLAGHTDNFLFRIGSDFEEVFRNVCGGDSVVAERPLVHKDSLMWLRS